MGKQNRAPKAFTVDEILGEVRSMAPAYHPWTAQEDDVLRESYGRVRLVALARNWERWFGWRRSAAQLQKRATGVCGCVRATP